MPGRQYTAGNGYRYGFNGKENDNEVKGEGNQQDYGMRGYDPRLGRFFSLDPLRGQYPELTPYQFASNKPINSVDLDGLESKEVIYYMDSKGSTQLFINKVDNPYNLGTGTIYHAYITYIASDKQINEQTIEIQFKTSGYHLYIPSKKDFLKKMFGGSLPQAIIFGSDNTGEYSSGLRKMDPNKKTLVIDFAALQEVMDLVTIGMSQSEKLGKPIDNSPGKVVERLDKSIDKAINPEKEGDEETTDPKAAEQNKSSPRLNPSKPGPPDLKYRTGKPIFCNGCRLTVQWNKKGKYWEVPSGPAKDSMEGKDHSRN